MAPQVKWKEIELEIPVNDSPRPGDIISGTLCIPQGQNVQQIYLTTTPKIAVLAHGHGGHRSYCYQGIVAADLSEKLQLGSFRFDFRNCGSSSDVVDTAEGRTLEHDSKDITIVADYLTKTGIPFGKLFDGIEPAVADVVVKFQLDSLIGHSRGAVVSIRWACNNPEYNLRHVVNCSGRFRNHLLHDKTDRMYPSWKTDKGYEMMGYRYGKYQPVWIPMNETKSVAQGLATDFISAIPQKLRIITIHGLDDVIVPVRDAEMYANLFAAKHTLRLVEGADHNFYGVKKVTEENAKTVNPGNLPVTKKNIVNYNYLVSDIIVDYLRHDNVVRRYFKDSETIGSLNRWKHIEGIFNFRDIGGYDVPHSKSFVRPYYAYRAADTSKITAKGQQALRRLGVTTIYDFRSEAELRTAAVPEIPGVEYRHVPVLKSVDLSPQAIALRYKNLLSDSLNFKYAYADFLAYGNDAFAAVFTHVRDRPNDPFVYHCTAGKDRTGVMTMLILLLCGVDDDTISCEYSLTTVGLAPQFASLRQKFSSNVDKITKGLVSAELGHRMDELLGVPNGEDDGKTAGDRLRMVEMFLSDGNPEWRLLKDGMDNLLSSKYESMRTTLSFFREKYGTVEKYLQANCGFSEADIEKIRNHLVVDPENPQAAKVLIPATVLHSEWSMNSSRL